ncbi:SpoIIE family protein phosphatase [Desulfofustis glycolicus]|uniref:HAMP domain-containing protein n=1 Tax=Desulfofustis glycolicus DSM 9705 TaxID=1121409 RepID=A0A1M5Y617_9BACT|nr:SpoIIE family protein phosphatase [Desulfofustis glycolicus]SHI07426.1 HAMP domain-containing protein [Desulfofustis glycolicus DSM 9705]
MKAIHFIPEIFRFSKLSLSSRITLYFAVFGLLIFYLTSIAWIFVSQKNLADSITRIVRTEISEMNVDESGDVWWNLINKEHHELRALSRTLANLTSSAHTILDTSIYGRAANNQPWQRLHLDEDDTVRVAPIDQAKVKDLSSHYEKRLVGSDSNLFLSSHKIALFVNITSPSDRGEYLYKVTIDKQGISCLLKNGVLNFIFISLGALIVFRIVAHFFAGRLVRPVTQLSEAATRVAEGDFSFQVPPVGDSEIGELRENFNKMIIGLRDIHRMRQLEVDVERAREFQQNFLPREIPNLANWDIATCFDPAKKVSGDFYDVFELPGKRLGLVIADVADKGIGPGLYMALIRSLIRVYSEQFFTAKATDVLQIGPRSGQKYRELQSKEQRVVQMTNEYFVRHHGQEGMFATLFFGVLEVESGDLVYINGGHEPLYIIGRNGIKQELAPTGPAVGVMADINYKAGKLQLAPGDTLFGFTDGVTEAMNSRDELFSRSRVQEILGQPINSSRELLDKIRQQVFSFEGNTSRSDDLTMLAIQRLI